MDQQWLVIPAAEQIERNLAAAVDRCASRTLDY
jgi:hypothetical protein